MPDERQTPVIEPGYTYASVTEKISSIVEVDLTKCPETD